MAVQSIMWPTVWHIYKTARKDVGHTCLAYIFV